MSALAMQTREAAGSCVFPDGSSLVRARQLDWTPWAVPGVYFKLLDVDRSFGKSTLLIATTESITIPAFKQSGALEMFLESGQLRFERGTLGQGDYVYLPGGSRNGPLQLASGTQVYMIVHGPLRIGEHLVDAEWMIDAVADMPAGDHIKAVLLRT